MNKSLLDDRIADLKKKAAGLLADLREWLKDRLRHHRVRVFAGLILLAIELWLYLGTDVMLEDTASYHTGEGSWMEEQREGECSFTQTFRPQYKKLDSISFLMDMEGVSKRDGQVRVTVTDSGNSALYEEIINFEKISNASFTDVNVDLELSPHRTYGLTIATAPSSAGEYPGIGLIGKEYDLPENLTLKRGNELENMQLVSRYHYKDTLPFSKWCNIVFISMFTALGVMFGLPEIKWVRRAAGILLLAATPYVLGSRLELLASYPGVEMSMTALRWNVGLMYCVEVIMLLCTHSPRLTIVLANVALTLLYSVNYFVIQYRGTPLRLNDFTAVGTAVKVVGDYSFVPSDHLAFVWGLLLLIVVFGAQTGLGGKQKRERSRFMAQGGWAKKIPAYIVTIALAVAFSLWGG